MLVFLDNCRPHQVSLAQLPSKHPTLLELSGTVKDSSTFITCILKMQLYNTLLYYSRSLYTHTIYVIWLYMVIWLSGYMVIWIYGYLVIWLYMVIWLYGYLVICLSGYIWLSGYTSNY